MTKHDFLGICMECEVDPNLVVDVAEVRDLLKQYLSQTMSVMRRNEFCNHTHLNLIFQKHEEADGLTRA